MALREFGRANEQDACLAGAAEHARGQAVDQRALGERRHPRHPVSRGQHRGEHRARPVRFAVRQPGPCHGDIRAVAGQPRRPRRHGHPGEHRVRLGEHRAGSRRFGKWGDAAQQVGLGTVLFRELAAELEQCDGVGGRAGLQHRRAENRRGHRASPRVPHLLVERDRLLPEGAGRVVVALQARQPAEVGHVPGREHREAAAAIDVQRLLEASLRRRPVARRDGRQAGLEQQPVQPEQVALPAQQRPELVEHRTEIGDLADIRERGLAAVECGREGLLVAGRARRGHSAPAVLDGFVERQAVAGHDRQPREQVCLHRAVADRRGDPQPAVDVHRRVVGRTPERDLSVAAERAQRDHLQPLIADCVGGRHRLFHVGDRLVIRRACLQRPCPGEQRPCPNLEIAGECGRVQGPREQRRCVVGSGPGQRLLAGQQPGTRGARPVVGSACVRRHRLGPLGQQVGRPAVVGQPGRRRRRRVEHLSDEVVGEFVVAPGDDEQPGGESILAARNHVLRRLLHQVGDDGRIERRAQHRGGAHQLLDRLAGAPHAREHGRLQRARDGRVAGRQRAQRLDHEQRVPAGLAQDHVRHPGLPGGRGEALDRLRRQRAEVEPVGDAGQLVDHVRALLGADGRDHEQSARPGLPDQEVDELHAGQSGVLQVVQAEQHRAAIRERPDERRDGLEGAPPLDLGAAALGRQADAEDGGNVRHERGEGARVVARQLAQRRRRQHAHGGRERVDDRLQEQRPLRLVATGGQHGAAGRAGDPPELVAQPGLADARLARDDDQPGLPVGGLVPGVAQAPQLLAASHQAE